MAKKTHRVLQKIDALTEEAWSIRKDDVEHSRLLAEQAMELVISLQKAARGERYTFGYAAALCALAYYSLQMDEYTTARERADEALALFKELFHDVGCARTHFILGVCDVYEGVNDRAIEHLTTSLSLLAQEPDPSLELSIISNIGVAHLYRLDYTQAVDHMEQALTRAKDIGDTVMVARQTLNLGALSAQVGKEDKGLKYLLQFLDMQEGEQKPKREDVAMAHTNIGLIFLWAGDYGTALEHLRMSLAIREEIGDIVLITETYSRIAVLYSAMKDYALVLPYLLRSLEVYKQHNIHGQTAVCLANIAVAEIGLGNTESGLRYAQKSLAVSRKIGNTNAEYHALLNIGSANRTMKKWEQAVAAYTDALAVVNTLDYARGKGGVYRLFTELYTEMGEFTVAQKYGKKALALLGEIDEKPLVRDIHKALTSLYEQMGKTKKELEHCKALYSIEERIRSEQASRQTRLMKVLHEVEEAKRDAENYRVKSDELEQQVEKQDKELAARALALSEREEFLRDMRKELQEACRGPKNKLEYRVRTVISAISTSLADGHTWNVFEELFTKVHNNFIAELKVHYPALSGTELKVCALVKINLSSKEISRLLHVSVPTVETYRHRIRKKVGLPPQETLTSFFTRVN